MRKSPLAAAAAVITALALAACGNSGNSLEHQQQSRDTTALVQNQPVPGFNYSQIRQELIDLEKAQADGVQTTTFFLNYGVDYGQAGHKPPSSCPSIGAPIPVSFQLTNPQQIAGGSSGYATISQMDPNGIYGGDGAGTYVMCVNGQGQTYAHYWEGPVDVVFGGADWPQGAEGPNLVGQPSSAFADIKSTRK